MACSIKELGVAPDIMSAVSNETVHARSTGSESSTVKANITNPTSSEDKQVP